MNFLIVLIRYMIAKSKPYYVFFEKCLEKLINLIDDSLKIEGINTRSE